MSQARHLLHRAPRAASALATVAALALLVAACQDKTPERFLTAIATTPTPAAPAIGPTTAPATAAADGAVAEGRALFSSVGCSSCHGADARGTNIAPPLAGHTAEQVKRQVRTPQGAMPAFSIAQLSDERLGKIAAYITSLGGAPQAGEQREQAASIVREPTDIPPPIGRRGPQLVRLSLETVEMEGQLADGATYTYWTFGERVPGPFLRVRVGDTVELTLRNRESSRNIHSIDLHAVTGPGGGAAVTQAAPGQSKTFTFKALNPGLYVYHCATPSVAHHITSGLYGLILVEPEGGLPPVDREFYVMQGEIYTEQPFGGLGRLGFSVTKLLNETPEYFVFNGAVGGLTQERPLRAKVGETVRIFFGVGGPNFISSFHVIGEIFDRVFDQASLTSAPLKDVQTTLVPPGGAAMVEFRVEVPGRYILVDHALSRLERGLAGFLVVEGPEDPAVYKEGKAQ